MMDQFDDYGIPILLGFGFFLIFSLLGITLYGELITEKVCLVKTNWKCTKSHTESHPYFIKVVGKVTVPQTTMTTVCDKYERKQ